MRAVDVLIGFNEGNPIADSATTGVRFRRTVTVGREEKYAGLADTFNDETAPSAFYGIEAGEFAFNEQQS